jgi:hypothetical protein
MVINIILIWGAVKKSIPVLTALSPVGGWKIGRRWQPQRAPHQWHMAMFHF